MTLQEMTAKGYVDTERDIQAFYKLMAAQYQKALTEINKEIEKIYNKIVGDRSATQIAELLKQSPSWIYVQANKFDRLKALQGKVQKEFFKASIAAGNMTVEASKTAITNNYYRQQYSIAFASTKTMLSFAMLNPAVIEISVLGTPEVWKQITQATLARIEKKFGSLFEYQPKHGTLIEVLLKNKQDQLRRIQTAIIQGLIQGKSSARVAREIKGIMETSLSKAMRIVRTETGRNMNAGAYANHNAAVSQGIELQRQLVATLDTRTRQQSGTMDGQIATEAGFLYPDGRRYQMPGNTGNPAWDINDRETVAERLEGFPPEERRGRNPVTGKNEVMSYRDFNTWAAEHGLKYNKSGRLVNT